MTALLKKLCCFAVEEELLTKEFVGAIDEPLSVFDHVEAAIAIVLLLGKLGVHSEAAGDVPPKDAHQSHKHALGVSRGFLQ